MSTSYRMSPIGSAINADRPHILSLPQEVLEEVVSYLPPPCTALLELRMTCSELSKRTEQIFGDWFFADLLVLMAYDPDVQKLLYLSKHPIYSSCIECVRLSFARVRGGHYFDSNHGDELLIPENWSSFTVKFVTKRGQIHCIWTKGTRDNRKVTSAHPLISANHDLEGAMDIEHPVRTALYNFKATGNVPALVVGCGGGTSDDVFQSTDMKVLMMEMEVCVNWRALDQFNDPEIPWTKRNRIIPCDPQLLETVCKAICETEYPVTHLELGCETYGVLLSPKSLPAHRAFENLKVLRLAIDPGLHNISNPEVAYDIRSDEIETALLSLLRRAKNLVTLGLTLAKFDATNWYHDSIFGAIVEAVSSSDNQQRPLRRLEALEFDHFSFDPSHLRTFISATHPILKRLKIVDCPDAIFKSFRWQYLVGIMREYDQLGLELEGEVFNEVFETSDDETSEINESGSDSDDSGSIGDDPEADTSSDADGN